MFNIQATHPFAFKRALNVGFSIAIAFIVNNYFSFSHEYWIALTALLVCQTTRGTPGRQGLVIFMSVFAAIDIASLLLMYVKQVEIQYLILSIIFIFSGYLAFSYRPQSNRIYFFASSFLIVLLIASLSPVYTENFMRYRVFDVVIGAFLGIVGLLPIRLDKEFSAGVLPILRSLNDYSKSLALGFITYEQKQEIIRKNSQIEMTLQDQDGMYPEWVYEIGFNRGLRSGFRFFLVNLERVTEIFFSMNYLISRNIDPNSLSDLQEAFGRVMQKNQELLSILIFYFQEKKFRQIESDFTSDMIELEKELNRLVPDNLDLLAVSSNNLLLTALVRDMRDLREILLQLVKSLPETYQP